MAEVEQSTDWVDDAERKLKVVIMATYVVLGGLELAYLLYTYWDDPQVVAWRNKAGRWWAKLNRQARIEAQVKRDNPYVQWEAYRAVTGD